MSSEPTSGDRRDFFVSFTSADREWAEWIASKLESAGYRTFFQHWDFRPGSNFVLEMHRASTMADRTIVVLSPEYLNALFTQPEWASSLLNDPTGRNRKLIPIRIKPCEPTGLLQGIVYADIVGLSEHEASERLLEAVAMEYSRPRSVPFPGVIRSESSGPSVAAIHRSKVRLTYGMGAGVASAQRELPFVVGVLGNLHGESTGPCPAERRFVHISRETFNDILSRFQPQVTVQCQATQSRHSDAVPITIQFRQMSDFEPSSIALQIPTIARLLTLRRTLINVRSQLHSRPAFEQLIQLVIHDPESFMNISDGLALLDELGNRLPGLTQGDADMGAQFIKDIADELGTFRLGLSTDPKTSIENKLWALDTDISRSLDDVFHDNAFQSLEATWRGLYYLVSHADRADNIIIQILHLTREELITDARVQDPHKSVLSEALYRQGLGMIGGDPFSIILGDYDFSHSQDDIATLWFLSRVCSEQWCPFVASASPAMFGFNSFEPLTNSLDFSLIFEGDQYSAWRGFRESYQSRFIGLVLPHVLMRAAYGHKRRPSAQFAYVETNEPDEQRHVLWGSPAFFLGACMIRAFTRDGWVASISGIEAGGLLDDLPAYRTRDSSGQEELKCPTSSPIPFAVEMELAEMGFIPLCCVKGSSKAAFLSVSSAHSPGTTEDEPDPSSYSLDYLMVISRFIHYITAMMHTKLGVFRSAKDYQQYLEQWLSGYVSSRAGSAQDRSRYPLEQAMVTVVDRPGRPGRYDVSLHLVPQYQLKKATMSAAVSVEPPL